MMYATQYRPGFIDIDEELIRDVEVADFAGFCAQPWAARWATSPGFVKWELLKDGIVRARTKNGNWVVGYLMDEPMYCTTCEHWRTHCELCNCGNSYESD